MKTTKHKAVYLVLTVTLLLWMSSALHKFHQKGIRNRRVEDVQVLTRVYLDEDKKFQTMEQLLVRVRELGFKLHSPIAVNPRLSCYDLVGSDPHKQGLIITENNNVLDTTIRVKSLADGTVLAETILK
ncbi:MAG: hypothetical protein FJ405_08660 [Verrucomicrobia bacterium]|nr:hypothetical protein [Verrucomicrobiota bacterium]